MLSDLGFESQIGSSYIINVAMTFEFIKNRIIYIVENDWQDAVVEFLYTFIVASLK